MLGNEENPGIMLLTLQELFSKISNNSVVREYSVKLWYIEIYNENIRDLLSNSDENLDIREDQNKGLIISGVTEMAVNSANEVIQSLK
jgi:kinesin family protein 18/19